MLRLCKSPKILVLLVTALTLWLLPLASSAQAPANSQSQQPADDPGRYSTPLTAREMMEVMVQQKNLVSWRKRAENILKNAPDSMSGHCLMGFVMHRAEGDLPRARYHLQKAKELSLNSAKSNYSSNSYSESVKFYNLSCFELMLVLSEMDRYDEKIALIKELQRLGQSNPLLGVDSVWSLMKLNHENEARQALTSAFNTGNPDVREVAWNSLGALEAELGHVQASYNAFESLLQELRSNGKSPDPTILRNIGEICLPLGRYDEAERYFQEATRAKFSEESFTNPYNDLAKLYLSQGRFTEAFDAIKKMVQWSRATKPFLYQQSMAENLQTIGEFLLELDYTEEAMSRLRLLVQRPDRRGGTSADPDQAEAGNLLTWQIALITRQQCLAEDMASSRGWEWWKLLWQRVTMSFDIKSAGEKTAALIVTNKRLTDSLRPYNAASISTEEWYRPHLVHLLGAGVCAAALDELNSHPPEKYPLEEPFLLTIRAEIADILGNEQRCAENLEKALVTLPKAEVLLRARTRAKAGLVYEAMGQHDKAMQHFQEALQTSPTVIRRLNGSIPISIKADNNPTIRQTVKMLKKSPRFNVVNNGFALQIGLRGNQLAAMLLGVDGRVLAETTVALKKDSFETAAALSRAIHHAVFSPRINLSSYDMNSLDGSNLSTSNGRDRLEELFNSPPSEENDSTNI